MKRNNKYIIGNVVIVVIVLCWLFGMFKYVSDDMDVLFMILLAIQQLLFLGIGWRYFIIKPQIIEDKKAECTEPVAAMLIDFKEGSIMESIQSGLLEIRSQKVAVYLFEWKGYEMTAVSDLPYSGVIRKNLPTEILVNPFNPNEIYEPKIERSRLAHYRFCGTMFMIFGFFSFFGVV